MYKQTVNHRFCFKFSFRSHQIKITQDTTKGSSTNRAAQCTKKEASAIIYA